MHFIYRTLLLKCCIDGNEKTQPNTLVVKLLLYTRLGFRRKYIHIFNVYIIFCDVQIAKIGRRRSLCLHSMRSRGPVGIPNEPNHLCSLDALYNFWVHVRKGRTDGRTHVRYRPRYWKSG